MDVLEQNGERYLRSWGEQRSQTSAPSLANSSSKLKNQIFSLEKQHFGNTATLTDEELAHVENILAGFQEVRFRILEAYYALDMPIEMIAESLQNPVSPETVNRWIKSSNHIVGSAMISVETLISA